MTAAVRQPITVSHLQTETPKMFSVCSSHMRRQSSLVRPFAPRSQPGVIDKTGTVVTRGHTHPPTVDRRARPYQRISIRALREQRLNAFPSGQRFVIQRRNQVFLHWERGVDVKCFEELRWFKRNGTSVGAERSRKFCAGDSSQIAGQ